MRLAAQIVRQAWQARGAEHVDGVCCGHDRKALWPVPDARLHILGRAVFGNNKRYATVPQGRAPRKMAAVCSGRNADIRGAGQNLPTKSCKVLLPSPMGINDKTDQFIHSINRFFRQGF